VQSPGHDLTEWQIVFNKLFFTLPNLLIFLITFAANVYVIGSLVRNELIAREVLLYEGERDPIRRKNFAKYYECKNTFFSLKYDHECIKEAIGFVPVDAETTQITQQINDLYIAIAAINRRVTRIF
jgi:hypothetical protein